MPDQREPCAPAAPATEPIQGNAPEKARPLRLVVVSGPDRGRAIALKPFPIRAGKNAAQCDLVLTDPTVSAVHLGATYLDAMVTLRDLGSTNGSYHAGARFETLQVGALATVTIGKTELQVQPIEAPPPLPPSARAELCGMHGSSDCMRRVFTLIERAAATHVTVLVEGETGTGKELAAGALHALSTRQGPFVICDLASLPAALAESELFGHVRGAFTGADRDRVGAFELADGGTIFLDEIGELPLELQPRLLRVLQEKQVRRVGAAAYRKVDVRVVAATNRDLAEEVRAGRFRADLYHRLSTVSVRLPPLRERRADIPSLAERFFHEALEAAGRERCSLAPEALDSLAAYTWPGNVRELRNVLERAVALAGPDESLVLHVLGLPDVPRAAGAVLDVDPGVPFHQAKGQLVDVWEREYLAALFTACGGNVSLAARRGGLDRAHLHKLLKKHTLA